jgi:formate dehydrogenase assembly factor FdhD
MSKLEEAPNLNTSASNPTEAAGVEVPLMVTREMEQQLAGLGLSQEEINKLKPEDAWERINGKKSEEQSTEKAELSPEEKVEQTEKDIKAKQEEMTRLSESIKGTKSSVNTAREKLGLPPNEEEPPSALSDKDKL